MATRDLAWCIALLVVVSWAVPTSAQQPSFEPGPADSSSPAPTAAPPRAQPSPPAPAARIAPDASAEPREAQGDTTLNDVLLLGGGALSLGLAPTFLALSNPDLSFGNAVQVSLVGTFGVLCAAGGATLMVVGGGLLALSPILALLGEDGAAVFLGVGVLSLGVGIGLFVLAPVVFSVTADVDGRFGDSTGQIAVVSTVSMLAAGAATLVGFLLTSNVEADGWAKVFGIAAFAFLAANVAYGITRAVIVDDVAPAAVMLTPPIPF